LLFENALDRALLRVWYLMQCGALAVSFASHVCSSLSTSSVTFLITKEEAEETVQ
jgi:hypothetical protein